MVNLLDNAAAVKDLLAKLTELSQTLNAESDSINDIIKRFEQILQQLNLGLEVWVSNDPIYTIDLEAVGEDGEPRPSRVIETELGFMRYDGTWQVCLRGAVYEEEDNPYGPDPNWRLIRVEGIRRLLDASRADRIEALSRFHALLEQLQTAAKHALKAIKDAKQLVSLC
jgi:hypothetical protein